MAILGYWSVNPRPPTKNTWARRFQPSYFHMKISLLPERTFGEIDSATEFLIQNFLLEKTKMTKGKTSGLKPSELTTEGSCTQTGPVYVQLRWAKSTDQNWPTSKKPKFTGFHARNLDNTLTKKKAFKTTTAGINPTPRNLPSATSWWGRIFQLGRGRTRLRRRCFFLCFSWIELGGKESQVLKKHDKIQTKFILFGIIWKERL